MNLTHIRPCIAGKKLSSSAVSKKIIGFKKKK